MRSSPLVEVDWLREQLDQPWLTVVDCRWRLGQPGAGRRLYEVEHVPGAAFLDVDSDLAAPPGEGRHPLPDAASFERSAMAAAIDPGSAVVAYDEAGDGGAARLWWLLRHFGHDAVAVLNGGLRAWRSAGGPLERGARVVAPGSFRARPRDRDTVDATGLREPALALIDARAPERYRGQAEPIDPVAGHVPGAGNAPYAELAPHGRYRPAAELRARLLAAGATEDLRLVAYCGSGITACTVLLAAEVAGIRDAALYPGSWSDWASRGLPVER